MYHDSNYVEVSCTLDGSYNNKIGHWFLSYRGPLKAKRVTAITTTSEQLGTTDDSNNLNIQVNNLHYKNYSNNLGLQNTRTTYIYKETTYLSTKNTNTISIPNTVTTWIYKLTTKVYT